MAVTKEHIKTIARNKKARHDYTIQETMEAGMVLKGTEVKSIRNGNVSFQDSFAYIKDGELWVKGLHISPYEQGNIHNQEPDRDRKLLMHKREIGRLHGQISQKGMAIIPLSVYLNGSRVKMELGMAKGKRQYDKRQALIEKTVKREIDKRMKERY